MCPTIIGQHLGCIADAPVVEIFAERHVVCSLTTVLKTALSRQSTSGGDIHAIIIAIVVAQKRTAASVVRIFLKIILCFIFSQTYGRHR